MGKKDANKPRGRMSSYAYFVQTCREEHKKKHPTEAVVFSEFTKKCAEKWKSMNSADKRRFDEMAQKDKVRYENEMSSYQPPPGSGIKATKGKKRTKDPNAPKRALSAFFFFCGEERPKVRAVHPEYSVADVAKCLGKQWETCKEKPKFEKMAMADKARFEKQMECYKRGQSFAHIKPVAGGAGTSSSPAKKAKVEVPVVQQAAAEEDDDDEDDDDEEDEEEDEEDEEDD